MNCEDMCKRPLKLDYTRVHRNYSGGLLLEQWQNNPKAKDGNKPEEWVASTIEARTDKYKANEGLSKIAHSDKDVFLRDIINIYPEQLLGKVHVKRYHTNPAVLVKLIDSCTRLYIQVHPDRSFAKKVFGSGFGKTEAWYILGGRVIDGQEPYVLLGFKEGVTKARWIELFENQDVDGMVSSLHRFVVKPGDAFFIESGVPHAIGSGCFLLEVQEPTDYTFRVERLTHDRRELPESFNHQGVGFDKMIDSFHYNTFTREEILNTLYLKPSIVEKQNGGTRTSIISSAQTDFFAMDKLEISEFFHCKTKDYFTVGVVLSGKGKVVWEDGEMEIEQADELFLPAALKNIKWQNTGNTTLDIILCFPPKLN